VCPVLDPAAALAQMERGWQLYLHHFERKWRRSLERKRALFPRMHDYDDRTLRLGMRELTQWLVARHTEFGSLQDYFDGYSIAGERLAGLQVPARILMAADDPVIPVADFSALRLPADARLEIAAQGGHCGFLQGAGMDGFAEAWVADQLTS
jgi:predicted alpha/beta-fold hydrolase